ncbi:sigma-54 interaction domain-containing protein [Anaerosolibacter sp.]|uniref:sigma-54 interaction domain-containing protein n=1 Tax=Anaerosolibacter sp. TaxID=1872527 RepID=UPI0039EE944A
MDLIFSKKNMEIILDYVGEGIQIIDPRGRIIYYNRTAAELEDINKEDTIGRHILEIYPSLSPDTSTLLQAIRTGKPIFNNQQTFINYKGKKITTINSSIPITSKGKIVGAIEISKNITDVKELSEKLVDLQEKLYKDQEKKRRKESSGAVYTFSDMIGRSKAMQDIKDVALKAAQTSSPILVYGETGTGKELLVQAIHNASSRKTKSFIAQNCGALPSALLEGILFGTVKGGFTGAEDRPGLFELADGGTLFLDEINSMPLELQVKLLRVLQDGTIRRVGEVKTRHVDVRIIAATNTEPSVSLENKELRRDLYYRLNAVELRMPELQERVEDISLLAHYFIDKFNHQFDKRVRGISERAIALLKKYDWPGNVRELEHVIEGAMNLMDGDEITLEVLPQRLRYLLQGVEEVRRNKENHSLKDAVEALEKQMISQSLVDCDWNVSHTAEELDIPRQTLQYKIRKYGLKR